MSYHDISIEYGDQLLNHFIPSGQGNIRVIESPEVNSNITSIEETLVEVRTPSIAYHSRSLSINIIPDREKRSW